MPCEIEADVLLVKSDLPSTVMRAENGDERVSVFAPFLGLGVNDVGQVTHARALQRGVYMLT